MNGNFGEFKLLKIGVVAIISCICLFIPLALLGAGEIDLQPETISPDAFASTSVAWGDIDNDGDLDAVVGNADPVDTTQFVYTTQGEFNRLYVNNGGVFTPTASWVSAEKYDTNDVAWGDMDNDGDLDLAVGNCGAHFEIQITPTPLIIFAVVPQPNHIYQNNNGTLQVTAVWTSTEIDCTSSVAWGDIDGNNFLDLVVGNDEGPNRIYFNPAGIPNAVAGWTSLEESSTSGIALADLDDDGNLDLAVGNGELDNTCLPEPCVIGVRNQVYLNHGTGLPLSASWLSDEADSTGQVAWGDVNGDGYPELAVSNLTEVNRIYSNIPDGSGRTLETTASWNTTESDLTVSVAFGDIDRNGAIDLAVGNLSLTSGGGAVNRIYLNDNGNINPTAAWTSSEQEITSRVAFADVDNDRDLDLLASNLRSSEANLLYRNVATNLDFTASPTTGQPPMTVTFTNTTSGDFSMKQWDLGDGITSTMTNTTHIYTRPGDYTVTLTVDTANGEQSLVRPAYIQGVTPPIADFAVDQMTGSAPLTVIFTNTTQGTFSTSAWAFGDGGTSNLANPSHTYTQPGVYTVTLVVDGAGGSSTLSRPQFITVATTATANFTTTPLEGNAPLTVTFTNLTSFWCET